MSSKKFGDTENIGVAPSERSGAGLAGRLRFQFGEAGFQLIHSCSRSRQKFALNLELLAGDEVEAGESAAQ
jgi:hypothetical protein